MNSRKLILSAAVFTTALTSLVLVASSRMSGRRDATTTVRTAALQPQAGSSIQYIRCAHLRAGICDALKVFGNRFETPGKERLIIVGTLTRFTPAGAADVVNVRLITEYPHLLRLEEQRLGQVRVLAFDGQQAWSNLGVLTPADITLIQSLVFDSADNFFTGQMEGRATRLLGRGFRLDNGFTPNYNGPFYDLYQVIDQTMMSGQSSLQSKLYYLNTNTLKVERVRYQVTRLTLPVAVQISTPAWHSVSGQLVPDTVERRENGLLVWKVTGTSWTLSPRADDGTFTRPALP